MVKTSRNLIAGVIIMCIVSVAVLTDILRVKECDALSGTLPSPTQVLETSKYGDLASFVGLRIDESDPFKINFVLDTAGNEKYSQEHLNLLVEFFLSAVTLPKEKFWVNLSPYEQDRIIDEKLLDTSSGRLLLEQDYVLKVLSSSLTHPDTNSGKNYWDRIINRNESEKNNISELLRKVWIVPKLAKLSTVNNMVLIDEASLSIESEEDYLKLDNGVTGSVNSVLEDQVNKGEHFALLRSFYKAFVLGLWYKDMMKETLMKDYINNNKVLGIDVNNTVVKERLYQDYLKSNQLGVYNLAKKTDLVRQKRIYSAGGFSLHNASYQAISCSPLQAVEKLNDIGIVDDIEVRLDQLTQEKPIREVAVKKARKARPMLVVTEFENLISDILKSRIFSSHDFEKYLGLLLRFVKNSRGDIAESLYQSDSEDGLVRISYIRWALNADLPLDIRKQYIHESINDFSENVLGINYEVLDLYEKLSHDPGIDLDEQTKKDREKKEDKNKTEEINDQSELDKVLEEINQLEEQEKQKAPNDAKKRVIDFLNNQLAVLQDFFITVFNVIKAFVSSIVILTVYLIVKFLRRLLDVNFGQLGRYAGLSVAVYLFYKSLVKGDVVGLIISVLMVLTNLPKKSMDSEMVFSRESILNQSPFLSALMPQSLTNNKTPDAISIDTNYDLSNAIKYINNAEYDSFKGQTDSFKMKFNKNGFYNNVVPDIGKHINQTDLIKEFQSYMKENELSADIFLKVNYLKSALENKHGMYRLPAPVLNNDYVLIPCGVVSDYSHDSMFLEGEVWIDNVPDDLEKIRFQYAAIPAALLEGELLEPYRKFKEDYAFIFDEGYKGEYDFLKSNMMRDIEIRLKHDNEFKSRLEVKEYDKDVYGTYYYRSALPLETTDNGDILIPLRVMDKKGINFTLSRNYLLVSHDEMPEIKEDKFTVSYLRVNKKFINKNWELFEQYKKDLLALEGFFGTAPSSEVYDPSINNPNIDFEDNDKSHHLKTGTDYDKFDLGPVLGNKIKQWKEAQIPDHLLVEEIKDFVTSYLYYSEGFKDFLSIFFAKGLKAYQKTINSRRGVCYDANKIGFMILKKLGIATKFITGYGVEGYGEIANTRHAYLKYWSKEKERWLVVDMTPKKNSEDERLITTSLKYSEEDTFFSSREVLQSYFKPINKVLSDKFHDYLDPRFINSRFFSIAEEIGHPVTFTVKRPRLGARTLIPTSVVFDSDVLTLPVSTDRGKLVYDNNGSLYLEPVAGEFYDEANVEYLVFSKEEYDKHFVCKDLFRYNKQFFQSGRMIDKSAFADDAVTVPAVEKEIDRILKLKLTDTETIQEITDFITLGFQFTRDVDMGRNLLEKFELSNLGQLIELFYSMAHRVGVPVRKMMEPLREIYKGNNAVDGFDVEDENNKDSEFSYYSEEDARWINHEVKLADGKERETRLQEKLLKDFVRDNQEASRLQTEIDKVIAFLRKNTLLEFELDLDTMLVAYWIQKKADINNYTKVLELKLAVLKATSDYYRESGMLEIDSKLKEVFEKLKESNCEKVLRSLNIKSENVKRNYVVTKDRSGWTRLKYDIDRDHLLKLCLNKSIKSLPLSLYADGQFNIKTHFLHYDRLLDVSIEHNLFDTDLAVIVADYKKVLSVYFASINNDNLISLGDIRELDYNIDDFEYLSSFLERFANISLEINNSSEKSTLSDRAMDKLAKLFSRRALKKEKNYHNTISRFVSDENIDEMKAVRGYEEQKYERNKKSSSAVGGIDLSDSKYTLSSSISIEFDSKIKLDDGFKGFSYEIISNEKVDNSAKLARLLS